MILFIDGRGLIKFPLDEAFFSEADERVSSASYLIHNIVVDGPRWSPVPGSPALVSLKYPVPLKLRLHTPRTFHEALRADSSVFLLSFVFTLLASGVAWGPLCDPYVCTQNCRIIPFLVQIQLSSHSLSLSLSLNSFFFPFCS